MAKGFKHGGGGGSSLNFKVVAYATADELNAAAPKDNTIGVITQNKITGWGFDSTAPEAPVEGMVWFSTAKSSAVPMNVLRKNTLVIYVTGAKQYVGSTWIDIPVYLRSDGKWVCFDSRAFLYKAGDECSDLTGGWNGTKGSNYISFGGEDNNGPQAHAINKISFEGYTKLVFEYEFTSGHGSGIGSVSFAVSDRIELAYRTDYAIASVRTATLETGKIYAVEIDVSSVTQAAYVRCSGWYGSGKMYNAWLVP